MKGRLLVLDELAGRQAAALVVEGRLEELAIDPPDDVALPGAICRAVADRPVKGQGGIFVKLPGGSGFLRQISGVAPGQRLIVQVTGHHAASVQVAFCHRDPGRARAEHQPPDQG
jgi:ribonuclease G